MPASLRRETILVRYPFSDLSSAKVRPAVVIHAPHPSLDALIVPLTSRVTGLLPGEFVLADWQTAGMNVPTAVKRGIYTIHSALIIKQLATLTEHDAQHLDESLRAWLGLP